MIRLSRQERRQDLSDEGPHSLSRNLSRASLISESSSDLLVDEFAQLLISQGSATEQQETRPLTPSRYFQKQLSYCTIAEDIDSSPICTTVTQRAGLPVRRFSLASKLDVPETQTVTALSSERRLSAEPPHHKEWSKSVGQLTMSHTHYLMPNDLSPVQPLPSKPKPPQIQLTTSLPTVLSMDSLTSRQKLSRRRYSVETNQSSCESDIVSPGSVEGETADGLVSTHSYVNVVDAFLCQKYDNYVMRKAEELKRHINGSTSWEGLYSEQNPCVLVFLLTTWLRLLLEPALPAESIKQLEMRLKVASTSKDLLQVFDKPQELLVQTLCEMLAEVLEGLSFQVEEVIQLFSKLLTIRDKDIVRDEMLTESRAKHGAVQTLIAMAHKFLRQPEDSQQDNPDGDTGLQPVVVMSNVLTRIIEEKLESHNVVNASSIVNINSSPASSRFFAGGSSPTRELQFGAGKLTSIKSEHLPVNRSVSNLSFGKKPLPPIGENVGCDVTGKDCS